MEKINFVLVNGKSVDVDFNFERPITLAKARDLANLLDCTEDDRIQVIRSNWTDKKVLISEIKAIFFKNCLTILRNGEFIYENNNGVICRDPVAYYDSISQY